ncbi:hypothetical protein KKA14_05545 [bacterium]|nr:hypothetical protein [bacterium]
MREKLNRFANNVTSQYGEDGILEYILNHASSEIIHTACEFGAWDGKFLSNIYTLWHDKGWVAVLIEADLSKYNSLIEKYNQYKNIHCLNYFVDPKGDNSLDSIFERNEIEFNIGILSIDIDSLDYFIWKYLDRVTPQIVIIEYNNTIPPFIDYHDPEGECFLRCSAKALESLGNIKGYKLICCTVTNAIFVKNNVFNRDYFPDMPVEYLFDYEGQRKNNTLEPTVVGSQFITSFPVFVSNPPKHLRLYYNIKKSMARVFKGGPKRVPPSKDVMRQLKKAGLYI